MSSNPSTVYCLDIFHINLLKKLSCLFKKTKINETEAEDVPFLSYSSPKRTSAKATIHVFAINPGRGKKEADNFYFSHFCNSRPAKTFATFNIHKYYY